MADGEGDPQVEVQRLRRRRAAAGLNRERGDCAVGKEARAKLVGRFVLGGRRVGDDQETVPAGAGLKASSAKPLPR